MAEFENAQEWRKTIKITNGAFKLANHLRVDIRKIQGTDHSGYIGRADILSHVESQRVPVPYSDGVSFASPLYSLEIHPGTLRPYQQKTVDTILKDPKSGIVIAPCGSGKTLMGAAVCARLGQKTLIVTTAATEQWKHAFSTYFSGSGPSIVVIGLEDLAPMDVTEFPDIMITTYSMLCTDLGNHFRLRLARTVGLGLLVLDEVHAAAASSSFLNLKKFPTKLCIGMTATPIREDDEYTEIERFIGPILVRLTRKELVLQSYLSDVQYANIRVPIPECFHSIDTFSKRSYLSALNPFKVHAMHTLVDELWEQKHQILIFCDNVAALHKIYKSLRRMHCYGPLTMRTTPAMRQQIISKFLQHSPSILCVSRVGDEGYDMPSASAAINMWNGWGSRRQIVQRIGRIARPGHVGRFYSILNDDSREVDFASHRDEFLEEEFTVKHQRMEASPAYLERIGSAEEEAKLLLEGQWAEEKKNKKDKKKKEKQKKGYKRASLRKSQ